VIDPADGLLVFDNVDEVEANGLEVQAEGRYEWLSLRASHAIQRATDSRTGDELSNSPRHLTKLNATIPLYRDKLYAGVEAQYHSEVRTVRPGHASDFVVANVNLFSRNLVKGLELSAGIYNLFDSRYGYPGSHDHLQQIIPQDGRSFRIKLTYKF
jgi:iron complex outermembrane receptor protein